MWSTSSCASWNRRYEAKFRGLHSPTGTVCVYLTLSMYDVTTYRMSIRVFGFLLTAAALWSGSARAPFEMCLWNGDIKNLHLKIVSKENTHTHTVTEIWLCWGHGSTYARQLVSEEKANHWTEIHRDLDRFAESRRYVILLQHTRRRPMHSMCMTKWPLRFEERLWAFPAIHYQPWRCFLTCWLTNPGGGQCQTPYDINWLASHLL